jgi:hypothetical protein
MESNELVKATFEIVREIQKDLKVLAEGVTKAGEYRKSHDARHDLIESRCHERHKSHDRGHAKLFTVLLAVFIALLGATGYAWQRVLSSEEVASDASIQTLP